MEKLIKKSEVENIILAKDIEKIIKKFNDKITRRVTDEKEKFMLNTGLDGVPYLDESQIKVLGVIAKEMGWVFSVYRDKYDTFTYELK